MEGYERAAAAGPARFGEALIARHSMRIENLATVADHIVEKCCPQLLYIHEIITATARDDGRPTLLLQSADRRWPDHMAWAADSTMAAIRLLLAGQIVGAAVIARQQLGRWSLLLARTACVDHFPSESADILIARTWTQRAIQTLGAHTGDVLAEGRFDDVDDETTASESAPTRCEHVRLADGRQVCPGTVYSGLSQIMNGTTATASIAWECLHNLDVAAMPQDVEAAVDCVLSGLELCTMTLRSAVEAVCDALGDQAGAQTLCSKRTLTQPEAHANHYAPEDQLLTRDSRVRRLTPALLPVTRIELATCSNWRYLGTLYDDYCNVLAQRSAAHGYTQQEVAKLAFAAHRYIRWMITDAEHANDLAFSRGSLIHQHLSEQSAYTLTAEFAALCARWNCSRPEIANTAMLISSTLRSGYWLWLEEDDRAIGILRYALQQTARLKAWSTRADLARMLESVALTTPNEWLAAAAWSKLTVLDRALFEFGHSNPASRADATDILGGHTFIDADATRQIRLTRQSVLDDVTMLAASETIRVVAAQQSPSIAEAMRDALDRHGLRLPEELESVGKQIRSTSVRMSTIDDRTPGHRPTPTSKDMSRN